MPRLQLFQCWWITKLVYLGGVFVQTVWNALLYCLPRLALFLGVCCCRWLHCCRPSALMLICGASVILLSVLHALS
jgi:hypothetical protein